MKAALTLPKVAGSLPKVNSVHTEPRRVIVELAGKRGGKQVLTTADPPLCTRNTLSMCAVGKFGPKAFWPTSDGWLLRLGLKNATFLKCFG